MPYSPNVWKDGFDGRTPITAAALTKIEEGIRAASATAEATGCPPKVTPWANQLVPRENGSASRSLTSIAPSGTYPLVRPLAQVMMSGW